MKKVNIYAGIVANIIDETKGYAEILISDGITEIPTDIDEDRYNYYNNIKDERRYSYDEDNYYTSCIGDFIVQNSIKNVKIIGGGDNLKDISYLFTFCEDLQTVDLSGLNTSNVEDMMYIFYACTSLKRVKLSGLNTSNVANMHAMFCKCTNLETLNLLTFDTTEVIDMIGMFAECTNLKRLKISNFKSNNLMHADCMFENCTNLETINMPKFKLTPYDIAYSMTYGCKRLQEAQKRQFLNIYGKD